MLFKGIHPQPSVLNNPRPTRDVKVERANAHMQRVRAKRQRQASAQKHLWVPDSVRRRRELDVVLPPLDVAALSRQYGVGGQNVLHTVTSQFRVHLDIDQAQFERRCKVAIDITADMLRKKGYVIRSAPKLSPGTYPATALDSKGGFTIKLLDQREFHITFECSLAREPEAVVIELPPELLQPLRLNGRLNS